jgi:hypothetical protein
MVPNELKTSMSDYSIYMDTAHPSRHADVALLTKPKPINKVVFGMGKFANYLNVFIVHCHRYPLVNLPYPCSYFFFQPGRDPIDKINIRPDS